ncbi:MAG: M23 family metallopeptidase [Deltaproteobacteria bacterium]
MGKIGKVPKRLCTPVTVMLVPHSRTRPLRFRVPFAGIAVSVLLCLVGAAYLVHVSVRTVDYYRMQNRLSYVTSQFLELKSTMYSLKQAESEFKKLFALKSKADVLEEADFADTGSLDMELLRTQIEEAMKSVTDIRKYVVEQKSLYLATPTGWPVSGGHISSSYGYRVHPKTGERQFHTGIDISVPRGTEVKATADGIVSFSGWTKNSGHVVVIEHGYDYSTAYAHNQKNLVKVGERVHRGDTIAISGSTGLSTGPHVHYEIWKQQRHMNPKSFLARR